MADEIIRTQEPYGNPDFLERATRISQGAFEGLVAARANGGFTSRDGQWHAVEGGPIAETTADDPAAQVWHDRVRMDCIDGGIDELLTTRYFRPA